ncbi:MAG: hypothetical protein ABJA33_10220 [Pedococcus sp.]
MSPNAAEVSKNSATIQAIARSQRHLLGCRTRRSPSRIGGTPQRVAAVDWARVSSGVRREGVIVVGQ